MNRLKLIYLVQIESQKYTGEPFIENLNFYREKNGPLSAQIYNALSDLKEEKYITITAIPNQEYGYPKFAHSLVEKDVYVNLSLEEIIFLNSILDDYLSLSQKKLKDVVYDTEPMLDIVEIERKTGKERLGSPLNMNLVPLDPQVLSALSQNEL